MVDYSGKILERDMIAVLNQIPPFLKEIADDKVFLSVTDISGCFATPGFLNVAKQMEIELFNHYRIKRVILGVKGAKVILLKTNNLIAKNKLVPFDNRKEALDFLTQD